MASLQKKGDGWYCQFVHHGKRHTFSIGQVSSDEAETKAAQVDYLLMRLNQRLIQIPPGMNVVDFIRFDGKPPAAFSLPEQIALADLRDRYLATHEASLEPSTVYGIRLHFKQLAGVLGEKFPIAELALADLQRFVDKRAKDKGKNGRTMAPASIKSQIVTLRTAWNWAEKMKMVAGRFPYDGLRYPKSTEKPPFQTRAEIERRIKAGRLAKAEIADLWDSLYLLRPEIDDLLAIVRKQAAHRWIYPAVVFVAHTGARRSETVRVQVHDVDFDNNTVLIHEKKRVRGQRSTRRVSLSPLLRQVLREWLETHPGGPNLFCHAETVARSKKRSATTGHQHGKDRAKSLNGRLVTVTRRTAVPVGQPITRDEFHDHFKRTLADTKWSVIKGAHALRHSFCSNLAMKGVDQRIIDEFLGHQTEQQRKRYRHLAPHTKAEALSLVFG